ncbi:hypothetical protein VNO80_06840 [Phaseolus coccineus]|uniref:Uncharacterized protein n=1 Tax=Phaseolus coccineus TaxID=3886 RepID=A0AAN9NPH5_PHACN
MPRAMAMSACLSRPGDARMSLAPWRCPHASRPGDARMSLAPWRCPHASRPGDAVGFEGDVQKQEDAERVVESTFKHFGRIAILVNVGARNFLLSVEDLSLNGFRTGILDFSDTLQSKLKFHSITNVDFGYETSSMGIAKVPILNGELY